MKKALERQEQDARSRLAKLGLKLKKSGVKETQMNDFGGYQIIEPRSGITINGARFEMSLEDVFYFIAESEDFLKT